MAYACCNAKSFLPTYSFLFFGLFLTTSTSSFNFDLIKSPDPTHVDVEIENVGVLRSRATMNQNDRGTLANYNNV